MVNVVEETLDVAFQNPDRRRLRRQQVEKLNH